MKKGADGVTWPATPDDLSREQERLASLPCEPWVPPPMREARRLARELRDVETSRQR